jgi:hypothetical protein
LLVLEGDNDLVVDEDIAPLAVDKDKTTAKVLAEPTTLLLYRM